MSTDRHSSSAALRFEKALAARRRSLIFSTVMALIANTLLV